MADEPPFVSRLVARWRRWWRRHVVADAPPYTDDDAERWRHRRHCTDPDCPCQPR